MDQAGSYQRSGGLEPCVQHHSGPRPGGGSHSTPGPLALPWVLGPVSQSDEEREDEHRPRKGDERQFSASWSRRADTAAHSAPSRVVGCARTQGTAPCLFPLSVYFIRQATRPKRVPVSTRPKAGASSHPRLEARDSNPPWPAPAQTFLTPQAEPEGAVCALPMPRKRQVSEPEDEAPPPEIPGQ